MIALNAISRTRTALVIVFVLTLCTRFAYFITGQRPQTGPWVFGAMAHNIVSDGHWFQLNDNAGPNFSFNLPLRKGSPLVAPAEADLRYADAHPRWVPFVGEAVGEAAVLAGLWELTGTQSYPPDVFFRMLLDAFTALLVYWIALRLFERRRAALLAATLYAVYPPLAWVVNFPTSDFWGVDFTIAIVAAYLKAIDSPRRVTWLLACGAITGLGVYFRSGVLILPAALALATVAKVGWRNALRDGLVTSAVAALLLVPWTIRNYNDFHAFIPTRSGAGQTLWDGLDEIPNGYGTIYSDYTTYQSVHRVRPDLRYLSPAYDSYLGERAVKVVEHHPLFYLRLVARRTWLSTLGGLNVEWMHSGTKTPFAYKGGPLAYAIERPYDLLQVMLLPLVFLLAMISLALTSAGRWRSHAVLLTAVLVTIVPYLLIHFEGRYMLPATFAYLIWIGLGADLLIERLAARRGLAAIGTSAT